MFRIRRFAAAAEDGWTEGRAEATGVINMDDIAEEEEAEEDQSRRESEHGASLPWLGLGAAALPCHGALNFIAFHSSRTRTVDEGGGGEARGRVSEHYTYLHVPGITPE